MWGVKNGESWGWRIHAAGEYVELPKTQRLGDLADTVELPTHFEAVDSFSNDAHYSHQEAFI